MFKKSGATGGLGSKKSGSGVIDVPNPLGDLLGVLLEKQGGAVGTAVKVMKQIERDTVKK